MNTTALIIVLIYLVAMLAVGFGRIRDWSRPVLTTCLPARGTHAHCRL